MHVSVDSIMDFCLLGVLFPVMLMFSTVEARFVVESHSLIVNSPQDIKGKYKSAIANFGIPLYGGSMLGTVKYPKNNKDFCRKYSEKGSDFATGVGELNPIILVDRGECFFTTKVYYAQLAGASAVLVADDKEEALITMDSPESDLGGMDFINNITIPSALIQKSTSDLIKQVLKKGDLVTVSLDWTEALPHPDERVEFEFWTNSNDECGTKCDVQAKFLSDFKGIAIHLEKGGYTQFTPHYITWYCPPAYVDSKQCKSQCINNGRYCAPDPEGDFETGYDGKDVVAQNLRELCVFRVSNESGSPWNWWDYVNDFKIRCRMSDKTYNAECAESVMSSLGIDVKKIRSCVGDMEKDIDNPILKAEQEAQVGSDERGDVTILPTVMVNNRQYRGKLDATAVLRAICSGFQEATEPPVCLGSDIQTNECLTNNGGCWQDAGHKLTACKDTFRGRVCECPHDKKSGVFFVGDGYTKCEPAGAGRCLEFNGGCWEADNNGNHFSACQEGRAGTGCKCPEGFSGDGFKCQDIDECAASPRAVCNCLSCNCKNTFGSYDCQCPSGFVYIKEHDACISKGGLPPSKRFWFLLAGVIVASVILFSLIGYVVYKYRLRSYMDSEIRAIMAQYMPLDSQSEPINRGSGQHEQP